MYPAAVRTRSRRRCSAPTTTDIDSLLWTRVSRGCTLSIKRKDGQLVSFGGFRDKDLEQVQALSTSALDAQLSEEVVNVSGRSWGKVDVDGPTLAFMVNDRATFRLPLQDVSQVGCRAKQRVVSVIKDDAHDG